MNPQIAQVGKTTDLRSSQIAKFRRGVAVAWLRVVVLVALDASLIRLAWYLAIRLGTSVNSPWVTNSSFFGVILTIEVGLIAALGLYGAGWFRKHYIGMIKAVSLAKVLLLLTAFLYEPNQLVSRSILLLSWLFSIILVCTGRFIFDSLTEFIRYQGAVRYPVIMVSPKEEWEKNVEIIRKENRYTLADCIEPSCLDLANREAFFKSLQERSIAEVFVSWSAIKNRLHLSWYFQTAGVTLRILTDREFFFPKSNFTIIGEAPCLSVFTPAIVGIDYLVKRYFDFCLAVLLVFFLSPIYVLIAVLIKLDSPGPIFFRQTRIGLRNRPFKVWKFRTMVADADKLQAALEAQNAMKDGVLFKMKNDPRITKIGRFLRRSSLDELPQIFNVLLGEMSFVGPRPLPQRDVSKFQPKHFIRQEVLPGITGLWQVSGRSDVDDFENAVKLDFFYITNWSLWLDVAIILRTAKVIFTGRGAY